MAVDTSGMCLLGAMDSLWFHQIVLLSQNSYFLPHEMSETVGLPPLEASDTSSRNSSRISVTSVQENYPAASDETSSDESENEEEEETNRHKERATQQIKSRCHSSSPISAKKQSRKLQYSRYYNTKFRRTRSCKSLTELELEEVKGFMDLGFIFQKENFTSRLMKLLPGLQRISAYKIEEENSEKFSKSTDNTENSEDEGKIGVIRPYLSEAWFTQMHDSPSLRLSIPRSATASAADMKKELKDWARTVALIIQQER